MRHAMTCLSFLAALGAALSGCAETSPPPIAPTDSSPAFYRSLAAAGAIVDPVAARDMISVYRRNKGLPTLAIDPALQDEARAEADAMARANSVDGGRRGDLAKRLAASHVERAAAVENVSAGYHTLAEAFSGWRDSQVHNAHMLDPRVRRMGIATAYAPGSKYKVFWALVLTD